MDKSETMKWSEKDRFQTFGCPRNKDEKFYYFFPKNEQKAFYKMLFYIPKNFKLRLVIIHFIYEIFLKKVNVISY